MALNTPITTEVLSGEARFVLQHLSQSAEEGSANHMGEVRASLEDAVTLEFADYLKFLKKYHYITLNRQEHTLGLTEEGARVAEGLDVERFTLEIGDYFDHRLSEPKVIVDAVNDLGGSSSKNHETRVARTASPDLRYVRYDELGAGGLATVYRGRHSTLGIDVAIKEIKDLFGLFSFLKREVVAARLDEAVRAQAALSHPAIVRIIDLQVEVAHPYFVMEYCPGGSLRQWLDAKDPKSKQGVSQDEALRIFLQILYGLREAHLMGVLHRGLKPENVLLDAQGNVKLGDFGLAALLDKEEDSSERMPQVFLGTGGMAYLAPEQLEATGEDLEASVDLYAAGVILYELLVGRVPGRRAPLPSAAKKGVDKKLDAIFDRLTADQKEERFHSADEALAAFYESFEGYGKKGELVLNGLSPETPETPEVPDSPDAKHEETSENVENQKDPDPTEEDPAAQAKEPANPGNEENSKQGSSGKAKTKSKQKNKRETEGEPGSAKQDPSA